ncbi:hypothetical protein MUK42_35816 [Musa troglodytarum]|uniref:Auxin-responsive protein n=1 Tax=Musa troglodytarum TaxID=320322 RepID=A0A9E7KVA2_9LILI|nr:hypothetical protein MUK42_35816 [Musa troglodytarum]
MGDQSNSPSSSIDSSSHPALCSTSSIFQTRRDLLSTDLKLGLGLSTSALHGCSSKERYASCETTMDVSPSSQSFLPPPFPGPYACMSASLLRFMPSKFSSSSVSSMLDRSKSFCTSSVLWEQLSHWPPIKPLLRSTLEEKVHRSHSKTFFVKVYMEGLPIGRKLDLLSHNGYDSLMRTLRRMFRTTITCPDTSRVPPEKAHVLTYEDEEGDWMMVGDVPWEFFLRTVKRLKITRADKC